MNATSVTDRMYGIDMLNKLKKSSEMGSYDATWNLIVHYYNGKQPYDVEKYSIIFDKQITKTNLLLEELTDFACSFMGFGDTNRGLRIYKRASEENSYYATMKIIEYYSQESNSNEVEKYSSKFDNQMMDRSIELDAMMWITKKFLGIADWSRGMKYASYACGKEEKELLGDIGQYLKPHYHNPKLNWFNNMLNEDYMMGLMNLFWYYYIEKKYENAFEWLFKTCSYNIGLIIYNIMVQFEGKSIIKCKTIVQKIRFAAGINALLDQIFLIKFAKTYQEHLDDRNAERYDKIKQFIQTHKIPDDGEKACDNHPAIAKVILNCVCPSRLCSLCFNQMIEDKYFNCKMCHQCIPDLLEIFRGI